MTAEVQALDTITAALTPLDKLACRRVLAWANDRFAESHIEPVEFDHDGFAKFMRAVAEAAREIGGVRPIDVLAGAVKLVELGRVERSG